MKNLIFILIFIFIFSLVSCENAENEKNIEPNNIKPKSIQTEKAIIDSSTTTKPKTAPIEDKTEISLSLKKQIFYDLVAEEDKLHGTQNYTQKARENIAQKYKLTIEQIKNIAIEGNVNNWPMPN